jgi:glycosyltransferase involved in cell wall biosynthesis
MSRVIAVSMVKDEADVIEATVRHLLAEGCEGVIVADNMSTDGTRDILSDLAREFGTRVWVHDDPEVGYYQARKMSHLAHLAGTSCSADWVVPFDADEIWYAPSETIQEHLALQVPLRHEVIAVPMLNHFCTGLDSNAPPGQFSAHPFDRMTWRQSQINPMSKVAFRYQDGAELHMGNHGVTLGGVEYAAPNGGLRIRHFPYRSPEQMIRKALNGAAAYAATDLPQDAGDHWRGYGRIINTAGEDALREVFWEHFYYRDPGNEGMIYDPVPLRCATST